MTTIKKNNKEALLKSTGLEQYCKAGGAPFSSENQQILSHLVEREVVQCVSSLLSDLAKFESGEYYDEVLRLVCPQKDYRLPVVEAEVAGHDWAGAAEELGLDLELYPDEEAHTVVKRAVADRNLPGSLACGVLGLEPYENEVFEHWAVSDFLRGKLSELGELTGDIYGMSIWGRCTTGQSISMDDVIAQIAARMCILDGQSHSWSAKLREK